MATALKARYNMSGENKNFDEWNAAEENEAMEEKRQTKGPREVIWGLDDT